MAGLRLEAREVNSLTEWRWVLTATAVPPADVADLCRRVGDIPGTNLPGLLTALSPDPDTTEQALRTLIAQAQELATAPPTDTGPDPSPDPGSH